MEPKKEFVEVKKDYRHIVRVANTDLDGSKPVYHALNKIKGVSFMFANALCKISNIDRYKKAGQLNEAEIKKINELLLEPSKYGFPVWMLNRRKDVETGDDMHLLGADLTFQVDNDIKLMKKIRSYKGVRHMLGQPVRGQSTKSNFRNKRGKKGSLGVHRNKTAAPAAKAPAKEKK
jgi:small subunit ribosomal protein S13